MTTPHEQHLAFSVSDTDTYRMVSVNLVGGGPVNLSIQDPVSGGSKSILLSPATIHRISDMIRLHQTGH
jgi:hypothetical protein